MNKLSGKGYYIWRLDRTQGGDIGRIAIAAQEAGLGHVLIKIANGAVGYNGDLRPLVETLQRQGIEVWGWHYIYGYPASEARMAARRIRESGVTGFVVNAEVEFKRMPNPSPIARAYMQALRAEVGLDFPIALSTYRYPRLHPQFPYAAFLEYCDFNMPQVYWLLQHNPVWQLEECIRQYDALSIQRPMIPTGAAWKEGSWMPTVQDLVTFMDAARQHGFEAANFWAWEHTELLPALWQAIADYDWPVEQPAPPEEEEMSELSEKLDQVLNNQTVIMTKQEVILKAIAALEAPSEPEPPKPPTPPAPAYHVRVTRDPGANVFIESGRNKSGYLILTLLEPRVQYVKDLVLAVTTAQPIDVDGTYSYFQLAGSERYLRADHVEQV